ncbi:MAG: hypothetical protein Q9173_005779 [Seirophora scorigena]
MSCRGQRSRKPEAMETASVSKLVEKYLELCVKPKHSDTKHSDTKEYETHNTPDLPHGEVVDEGIVDHHSSFTTRTIILNQAQVFRSTLGLSSKGSNPLDHHSIASFPFVVQKMRTYLHVKTAA